MHVLREQREYEVLEAAQEEHAAWTELERAIRPERADEALVQVCRERSLAQIASELRRVEHLRPQLNEVRSLLADLEQRARQVRTEWLLSQATSVKASRRPTGRPQ